LVEFDKKKHHSGALDLILAIFSVVPAIVLMDLLDRKNECLVNREQQQECVKQH
jgi:hypothetical protein